MAANPQAILWMLLSKSQTCSAVERNKLFKGYKGLCENDTKSNNCIELCMHLYSQLSRWTYKRFKPNHIIGLSSPVLFHCSVPRETHCTELGQFLFSASDTWVLPVLGVANVKNVGSIWGVGSTGTRPAPVGAGPQCHEDNQPALLHHQPAVSILEWGKAVEQGRRSGDQDPEGGRVSSSLCCRILEAWHGAPQHCACSIPGTKPRRPQAVSQCPQYPADTILIPMELWVAQVFKTRIPDSFGLVE